MWFWIFMFLCNLLIPLFMAGFGRVMLKHPPKEINNFFGYRTAMSRKNRDTWDFAHALCGKIMVESRMAPAGSLHFHSASFYAQ